MSGPEQHSSPSTSTTSSSSLIPTPDENDEVYHRDFASPTADFVVRASDNVRFKCHRLFLQEASPVFRTMLSLPQPTNASMSSEESTKHPSIDLPEDATTVETLLRLIYPMVAPVIDSITVLSNVLFAAEKYDMAGVISTLRFYLRDTRFLETDPVQVYALACRFSLTHEARLASRATLTHDVHAESHLPMFIATGLKMTDLFALLGMRHRRIEGMRTFLEGDRFEGNAPDFSCVSCDKRLNDISWPLLKSCIITEMYRRPLGDTLFGAEFLTSPAVHAFINCKCDGESCGERVIYEKGKTLAMISDFLKTLPDSADVESS